MASSPPDTLQQSILALLSSAEGALGTGTIACILELNIHTVRKAINALKDRGSIKRKLEHHVEGWLFSGDAIIEKTAFLPEDWEKRMTEYALFSPGVSLSEIRIALRQDNLDVVDRVNLLLSALHQAGEIGEFRLVSSYIRELMCIQDNVLSLEQIGEILRNYEPRKLRDIKHSLARKFIKSHLNSFETALEKILAMTRLGELELMDNDLIEAEKHLDSALQLSMKEKTGNRVPEILESMVEIQRDFQGMKRVAANIQKVINWSPELEDDDLVVKILATAAASLAGLRMETAAETAIQSAMAQIPVISPSARQVLEWCRAKVCMASGNMKTAIPLLERALLLAVNLDDQMAVTRILNTIVSTMKWRPGYSIRSLVEIMERVSDRTATGRNVSNQLYVLDHLVDMYFRTLQIRKAESTKREICRIILASEMQLNEPVTEWFAAFMDYLLGREVQPEKADLLLPGTARFLQLLRCDEEPVKEAKSLTEFLLSPKGSDAVVFALFLAMVSFAEGHDKASAIIASTLDLIFSRSHKETVPSWKLCISGLLASKPQDAEDFFNSAQVLARQMDRLLLVWMILRCRISLDLQRDFTEESELMLLLVELDQYISNEMTGEDQIRFNAVSNIVKRAFRLEELAGQKGSIIELRDVLASRIDGNTPEIFSETGEIYSRISVRSEISLSLETLGILARADKIQAIRIRNDEIRIIEGYGLGKERLPGKETERTILAYPESIQIVDKFGKSPFGSRRYTVVPTERSVISADTVRRSHSLQTHLGSYLLLEMDTPFKTLDRIPELFLSILYRQIGSALLLRDRESMAYIDTLTGSVIGYSWTKRLRELLDTDSPENIPLSVLLVDVDRFSEINDLFGYREGDSILKSIVSTISETMRPNDMIGRMKEDLFGVILPNIDSENALKIANRLRWEIARSVLRPDQVPVTVSVGTSTMLSAGTGSEMIISRAFSSLQRSKDNGRNRTTAWTIEDSLFSEKEEVLATFDTGDPGWDHTLSQTVFGLLTVSKPAPEILARKLRDALRSECIHLEAASGAVFEVGTRFARIITAEIQRGRSDTIVEHSHVLGKYHVLSAELKHGGRLISAWDDVNEFPGSIKSVFKALAALSDILLNC